MIANGATGASYNFRCYNASNQVWNGSAYENYSAANYVSYRVTATEQGTSGDYTGTEPALCVFYELRITGASETASVAIDRRDIFPANFAAMSISSSGYPASNTVQYLGQPTLLSSGNRPQVAIREWIDNTVNPLISGNVPSVVKAYDTGQAPLQPTVAGRTLDVSTGGEAGLDWANVGSPTTTLVLSGTTVGTITTYTGNTVQTGDSYTRIGALGAGLTAVPTFGDFTSTMKTSITTAATAATPTIAGYTGNTPQTGDSYVRIGALGAGLTAVPAFGDFTSTMKTSLNNATPAVTVSDKTGFSLSGAQTFNLTGSITGSLSGSVGSVTGAVGSVTSAVTVGTLSSGVITSASFTAGAINAAAIATDAIGSLEFSDGAAGKVADMVQELGGLTDTEKQQLADIWAR